MPRPLTDDEKASKFDLYGALYLLCLRYHSGQWSRGYRILCRLDRLGYKPGVTVRNARGFESEEQRAIYKALLKYRRKI